MFLVLSLARYKPLSFHSAFQLRRLDRFSRDVLNRRGRDIVAQDRHFPEGLEQRVA